MKRIPCQSLWALVVVLLMAACGGGGGSAASSNAVAGNNSVITAVRGSAPAGVCPDGGIQVDAGIDDNGNSVLDPSEVDSTQYVCNGAAGSDGLSVLVSVATEAAGANCPSGGKKVSAGPDTNKNNILDAAEITSSNYICNGTEGQAGTSGHNSLTVISSEPSGTNCASGGLKVSSWLDTNDNGTLDPGEVSTTNYVCNGPAGPGLTWVEVTGTSQQAQPNTGYLTNNAARVTVTLPVSLDVGDIVRVSGMGTGGWKVAQNAGQSIITKDLFSTNWTPRDVNRAWRSVASSADGTKLAAVVGGGQIYTSTDSGQSWNLQASSPTANWVSIASSSDGTKLVAATYGGQLYTSLNSGQTWTDRESNRNWNAVATSADGTKLVAVVEGGQIYTSTDSGLNWTMQANSIVANWISVASSSDGARLIAAVRGAMLYTSVDSGQTWTPASTFRTWRSVASSADGTKLVAIEQGGRIYTSGDSGQSWNAHESNRQWLSVASSSDGTKLVAAVYGGQLYTSADSGQTWTPGGSMSNWWTVASSSDGTRLVAAIAGGQIYTSLSIQSTTVGTAGSISGGQYDAIELQYIGNNTFIILSHEGDLVVSTASPSAVNLTTSKALALADGVDAVTILADVRDIDGAAIADGTPVTFSVPANSGTLSATMASTANGIATATLTHVPILGANNQTVTVTATAGAITRTIAVKFVNQPVSADVFVAFNQAVANLAGLQFKVNNTAGALFDNTLQPISAINAAAGGLTLIVGYFDGAANSTRIALTHGGFGFNTGTLPIIKATYAITSGIPAFSIDQTPGSFVTVDPVGDAIPAVTAANLVLTVMFDTEL